MCVTLSPLVAVKIKFTQIHDLPFRVKRDKADRPFAVGHEKIAIPAVKLFRDRVFALKQLKHIIVLRFANQRIKMLSDNGGCHFGHFRDALFIVRAQFFEMQCLSLLFYILSYVMGCCTLCCRLCSHHFKLLLNFTTLYSTHRDKEKSKRRVAFALKPSRQKIRVFQSLFWGTVRHRSIKYSTSITQVVIQPTGYPKPTTRGVLMT